MKKRQQIAIIIGLLYILISGGGVEAQAEEIDIYIYHDDFAGRSEQFDILWEALSQEFAAAGIAYDDIAAEGNSPEEFARPFIYLNENSASSEIGAFKVSTYDPVQIANSPFLYTHYTNSGYPDLGGFQVQDTEPDSAISAISGFALYIIGDCEQAIPYLLSDDVHGASYDLSTIMTFYAANCYLITGEYQNAAAYFTSVLDAQYGNHLPALNNLGWAYLKMGSPEYATSIFDFAISEANSPDWYRAILLSRRAQLYALAFDYDSAIADMDTAIELAEENDLDNTTLAELYTIRGEIIFLIYEWDRVLDNFNHAIELDPTYAPAYFQRGILYYTMTLREEALADFQTYLELEPDGIYADQAQDYIDSIQIELETLGGS